LPSNGRSEDNLNVVILSCDEQLDVDDDSGVLVLLGSGEAYDKVARMLGLELKPNGGAALELIARQGNPHAYPFAGAVVIGVAAVC